METFSLPSLAQRWRLFPPPARPSTAGRSRLEKPC